MPQDWSEPADEAARLWRQARFPIAVTGAGISVPSGIPDFRSPGGLWEKHDPQTVATAFALRQDPRKVWEFLLDMARLCGRAQPNPAHAALAELEAAGRLKGVITQNVDGLHQAAGSAHVVEFHGSARRYYCSGCRVEYDAAHVDALTPTDLPWRCGDCSGVIRPDIVFFGEHIPAPALTESLNLARRADFCLVAGTSGNVAPANALAPQVKQGGGAVVEINLGETDYADLADVRIDAPLEAVLPRLAALVTSN